MLKSIETLVSVSAREPVLSHTEGRDWIVCQIGAREHYVIASELHRRGRLRALCTDVWAGQGSAWRMISCLVGTRGQAIRDRYTSSLVDARVLSEWPTALVLDELKRHLRGDRSYLTRIMTANRRFAKTMAANLVRTGLLDHGERGVPAVFAYSYGALEILRKAKTAGSPIVLGQIDGGPREQQIVREIAAKHGLKTMGAFNAPDSYWTYWQEEVALADRIVANSRWSAAMLSESGVPEEKIRVVPLAFDAHAASAVEATADVRQYPERFEPEHPLELLFLGQAVARKGIVELVDAMRSLSDAPIRLRVVGKVLPEMLERFDAVANVEWLGWCPRSDVSRYFQKAHLFILPTHSDGFALTQLEALAAGTPVIASRHCGEVVEEGVNGLLLDAVSPELIAEALRWAIANPNKLAAMSARAPARLDGFKTDVVIDQIEAVIKEIL